MENVVARYQNLKVYTKLKRINGQKMEYNTQTDSDEDENIVSNDRAWGKQGSVSSKTSCQNHELEIPLERLIAEIKTRESRREVQDGNTSKEECYSVQQGHAKKDKHVKDRLNRVKSTPYHSNAALNVLEKYEYGRFSERANLVVTGKAKTVQTIPEKERKQRSRNIDLFDIIKDQEEFHTMYQEMNSFMKTLGDLEEFKCWSAKIIPQLRIVMEPMDRIRENYIAGAVMDESQMSCSDSNEDLQSQVGENLSRIKAERKQMKEQRRVSARNLEKVLNTSKDAKAEAVLQHYVSLSNFKIYIELEEFLGNYKKNYVQIVNDPDLELFKYDCKKAVSIPVNTSSVCVQNLLGIYKKLHKLLSGKPVVVEGTVINASYHPQGIFYCTAMLAEKFVLQGYLLSSNPETAFTHAALIVALWNDFPDFGKLVLALFYKHCPYLLPWYVPQTVGQTKEDYYKSQGYRYIDGEIERQDAFLKRMAGLMRLYSAIFITNPKGGRNNPHGFSMAWRWCASILNLDPRTDITATMLGVFLETAGFSMQTVYGKMFVKIVEFIRETYLPLMMETDSGRSAIKLEILLQDYNVTQGFKRPNGVLSNNFW